MNFEAFHANTKPFSVSSRQKRTASSPHFIATCKIPRDWHSQGQCLDVVYDLTFDWWGTRLPTIAQVHIRGTVKLDTGTRISFILGLWALWVFYRGTKSTSLVPRTSASLSRGMLQNSSPSPEITRMPRATGRFSPRHASVFAFGHTIGDVR